MTGVQTCALPILKAIIANGSIGGSGQLLTSNSTGLYWSSPGETSVNTDATYTWTNTHVFTANLTVNAAIIAGGNSGTAGQVLTSNGSGNVYWSTVTGGSNAAYSHQFFTGDGSTNTFTFSGGYTSNTLTVYLNGVLLRDGVEVDTTNGNTFTISSTPVSGVLIDAIGIINGDVYTGVYSEGNFSANSITIGSNVSINTSAFFVGNSSVNAYLTSTGLYVNGVAFVGGGSGTVTSVESGAGLTGGPITTSGTLAVGAGNGIQVNADDVAVLANNGITANSLGIFVTEGTGVVVNSAGVHVNSAYINTISSNNAYNLNGQPASYYTNATNITTGTLPWAQAPTGTVNTSASFTFTAVETFTANLTVNTAIIAGGNSGTAGQVLTSNGSGNVYWSTVSGVSGGETISSFLLIGA